MSMRWRLYRGLIDPDLARMLTRAQQESVLQRMAHHRLLWRQATRSAIVPLLVANAFIASMMVINFWTGRHATPLMHFLTAISVPIALLAFFFPWIARRRSRRAFLCAVRDLGYDLCTHCGYWLRELDDSVKQCPECGAQREPMPVPSVNEAADASATRDE